ncbi:MAG: hypothetical protein JW904_08900 [Spirochaetales bacterium]|nr:hypothetical protein [Spirochaetales bacterium]
MKYFVPTILMVCWLAPAFIFGQAYEGHGRNPDEFNSSLSDLKVGSVIDQFDTSGTGSFNSWSTSFLSAEGEKPVKTDKMNEDLREYEMAVDQWSCMYSPQRAQDGDAKTAWCEDAEGDGIGETLVVKVNVEKPVKIWGGYGKSNAAYLRNSRPQDVLVSVMVSNEKEITQTGEIYKNITVLAQTRITLDDKNNYQSLPLPMVKIPRGKQNYTFIAIKILSVYPGSKYEDTLISEVSN